MALLEDFSAARISNDDLEEQFGPSADHGLIGRCVAFLRTDDPYSWPVPRLWQRLVGAFVGILTLGTVQLAVAGPRVDAPWPFIAPPSRPDLPRADVTG